jgi:hypothetical protein
MDILYLYLYNLLNSEMLQIRNPFVITKKQKTEPATDKKEVQVQQSLQVPQKIYVERTDDGFTEYSDQAPAMLDKFYALLNGFYGSQNFIELFHCLPEIFAPINEIASRVSDATWQLCKDWNNEVDYNDQTFNRLFSQPNPLEGIHSLIYNAVCYEILTGGQFWYYNKPDTLAGDDYSNILHWWNLQAHDVLADQYRIDPYSATEIGDFVRVWKEPSRYTGRTREFDVKKVLPILHLGLGNNYDLNCRKPLILGAEKPIRNLIPVYEARGVIYIKRGAMGFVVSRKSDESGFQSLTPNERKQLDKDFTDSYGITGNKETISKTGMPVDFIRTAMSIQELQPFDETLADAAAIYAVLKVPPHLIPSKDKSTFANASSDMKAFYTNVIIPWAKRYAGLWTSYLKIPRRFINPDYSHIDVLQDNRKEKSDVDKTNGDTWEQRFLNGTCTLNDWIVSFDGNKGTGGIYDKKLPDMTPEEIESVKAFLNMKAVVKPGEGEEPKKKKKEEEPKK